MLSDLVLVAAVVGACVFVARGTRWAAAIECAEQYAAANGFGQELTFRVAGIEELGAEKFDLVLANLDRNTLLRHPRALAEPARPGGALFVTGICPEDYDDVAESFSASGCGVCGGRERDGWLALEIRSL